MRRLRFREWRARVEIMAEIREAHEAPTCRLQDGLAKQARIAMLWRLHHDPAAAMMYRRPPSVPGLSIVDLDGALLMRADR